MVSITILALGADSFIARAASMPLVLGMRMSIRTTSKELTSPGHRLGAITGLAHQLDVGLVGQDHLQPAPEERVIIGDQHANEVGRGLLAGPLAVGSTGTLAHAVSSHLRPLARLPAATARRRSIDMALMSTDSAEP